MIRRARRWLARYAALTRLADHAERGGYEVSNARWRELEEQARRIAGFS